MKNYSGIIGSLSGKLTQNGLYYSGREFNSSDPAGFEASELKVLICRLSTYRDTAQSFTHPLLYKTINSVQGVFADTAYLPPPNDLELFRKNNIPLLLPVSTKVDPAGFDVIAISNSLVQELLNISTLLKESGIEVSYDKRICDESQPLVIVGGSNSANCHFLMHKESPVDLIFTGEDPYLIADFFAKIKELKLAGLKKPVIIAELFKLFPVATPVEGQNGIKNMISSGYNSLIQPAGAPVLFKDDPGSTNLVISRGCPWFCSFCNESFRSKPYSEVCVKEVLEAALEIKKLNGSDEVSLFSFNFNAHSGIEEVLGELHKMFRVVSLKSQRFDILSLKSEFLKLLQFSGKTSITCGLEGISERMRSFLSKDLSGIELEMSLKALLDSPVRTLKIFLIATGMETDEDISEFNTLVRSIKQKVSEKPRPPRIVFSLTPLVRFPGTPLGAVEAYPVNDLERIMSAVSSAVRSEGFEFRPANSVYEYWVSQVLLRNNSVEFYDIVQGAVSVSSFIYYNGVDKKFYDRLFNDLKKLEPFPDKLLNNGLEFTHINSNIDADFIASAAKRAIEFTDTHTCLSIKNRSAACNLCGACETADQRKSAMSYEKGIGLTVDRLREIKAEYSSGVEISVPVILKEKCRGLSDSYIGAVLTSAAVRALPEGSGNIKRFVRLNNRVRFLSEEMLGADEAVFLCSFNDRDSLLENFSSEVFRIKFAEYAQDFAVVNSGDKALFRMIFTINDTAKKIDTSFIAKFHIKSTVTRAGEGIYQAQVSKDGLKKRQFSKVLINIPQSRVEVHYGEKFDLNGFVKVLCDEYKLKKSEIGIYSSANIEV
jgi:hypothetical protein